MNEKMIPEETFRYILEAEAARYERTIRRLIIAFTIIILFMLTIAVLIIYNYDIDTVSVDQDGEGVNIVGDSNGVDYNGADGQNNENAE